MAGVTEETEDHLTQLSPHLVALILRCLPAEGLLRLSVCSRYLSDCVCAADDVWQALCGEREWAAVPPASLVSWHALFLERRARLCRDCGVSTPYVFTLLKRRLCERCEESPRYRLITEAQALEFLPASRLRQLGVHELRGVLPTKIEKQVRASGQSRFFLLSAVESLAEQLEKEERRRLRLSQGGGKASGDGGMFALEDCEGGGEPSASIGAAAAESDSSSESEEEPGAGSSSDGAAAGGRRLRLSAVDKKAARKVNKEATKAANRERRAAKSEEKRGGGGSLPDQSRFLARTPPAAASPPGSLPSAGQRKKPAAAGGRGGRPKRWGAEEPGGGPSARARVEDALGSFGISGLELCV